MKPAKIDVVVATVNRFPGEGVFASLRSQRFKDFRLIVISQGEADFDGRLAEGLAHVVVRTEAFGLSMARNLALREVSAPVVSFLDDDAAVGEEYLERIWELMSKLDAVALCGVVLDPVSGRSISRSVRRIRERFLMGPSDCDYCMSSALSVRREACLSFDESLGIGRYYGGSEETDYLFRLLDRGQVFFDSSLVVYHESDQSKTHRMRWREVLRRGYSYGAGRGGVLRKHHRSSRDPLYLLLFARTLLYGAVGMLQDLARLHLRMVLKDGMATLGKVNGFLRFSADEGASACRVLMITARADYGGGPEHLYRLIGALPKDIEPYVVCPTDVPYWDRYASQMGERRMLSIPHRRFSFCSLWSLRRFARRHRIHLIHSHGKGAGVYGRLLSLISGVPCVHTFHGVRIPYEHRLQGVFDGWMEWLLGKLSRCLVAVSSGEAETVLGMGVCGREKLRLVENGVAIPGGWNEGRRPSGPPWTVLHMTRFDSAKHTDLLVGIWEAMARSEGIGDLRALVLGRGPDRDRFLEAIRAAGLERSIEVRDPVPDPSGYLREAFCYLSTSRWEGMPLAVIEAMALGVPVVATSVVGNRDVVDHGRTGFLYGLDRPEEAAGHLLALVDDPAGWERLSLGGREKVVRAYSEERMARQVAAVYREVCSRLPYGVPRVTVAGPVCLAHLENAYGR
jgi:glycosyltransferase involved in cell wall biosynthesis